MPCEGEDIEGEEQASRRPAIKTVTWADDLSACAELGLAYLALQYYQLVAQGQDLQVLLAIAHRQQSYEADGGRQGEVWQSQQHSRASWQPTEAAPRAAFPAWGAQLPTAHR
jgi:hypothetical protein